MTEKKSVFISLCSNLFHYYAFSVYAFSAIILAPLFFHTESPRLTRILGLLTFSMPFLLKPVGNIVFGHIGDQHGRKKALICSLSLITLATTSIGLLPTYDQIGWLSGVLLSLCLVIQGLCVGGQYTGALIYIQEHTKKGHAAFASGLVGAIGIFGTLLGTATSYFFDSLGGLESWEWRLPFLLSAIAGGTIYTFMRTIKETPVFMETTKKTSTKKVPLFDIFKNYKLPLMSAIFISSIPVSLFYIAAVYIPNFYMDQNSITSHGFSPLALSCVVQILCIFLAPLLGLLADRWGTGNQLKFTSTLLIITPILIFSSMTLFKPPFGALTGIAFFGLYASLYTGPAPAYLAKRFPVVGKYSGMGLGISLGEGIFGGLAPLACVALQQYFDSRIAPAYFMMGLGILSLMGIFLSRRLSRNV